MKRSLRVWIALVLAVALGLPAAPALGHGGPRHDCCAGMSAHHAAMGAGDCATSAAASTSPLRCSVTDGGAIDADAPSPMTTCLHCYAAAASGSLALHSPGGGIAAEVPVYVPATQVPAYVPARPLDRLERPPKSASF